MAGALKKVIYPFSIKNALNVRISSLTIHIYTIGQLVEKNLRIYFTNITIVLFADN